MQIFFIYIPEMFVTFVTLCKALIDNVVFGNKAKFYL